MTTTIHLLFDVRAWLHKTDPELLISMVGAKLPYADLEMEATPVAENWSEFLPRGRANLVFLLLDGDSQADTLADLQAWLKNDNLFYLVWTDSVPLTWRRDVAALTANLPNARAPYRIAQRNSVGLDGAALWIADLIKHNVALPVPPPRVRIQPTRWQHIPSNPQVAFAVPDQLTGALAGAGGMQLIAASTRGKTHAHQGGFREDAFAIAATPSWNILAVADGAGTASYARLGSNSAAKQAVAAIQSAAPSLPTPDDIGAALISGLTAARQALTSLADEHELALEDLHTTLLLMIHAPARDGCTTGLIHIGDGLITAESAEGEIYILTDPDTDPEENGATLFLTSGTVRQWAERAKVYNFPTPLETVALMTDGLANDLDNPDRLFQPNIFEALRRRVLCYPATGREAALLSLISYDKRGSFDDRTLAILTAR